MNETRNENTTLEQETVTKELDRQILHILRSMSPEKRSESIEYIKKKYGTARR